MSATTILSVLARPNPHVIPWNITSGQNTLGREYLDVTGWELWKGFNYKALRTIFKDVVEAPWTDPPAAIRWSMLDVTYGNEDGLEHQVLSRETISTVNAALLHAQKVSNSSGQLHLARRGRCPYGEDNRFNPDWALVHSELFAENGQFLSILPGDSKLSAKWTPDLYFNDREQWKRPVQQVLTYANDASCRYGFIITDSHLVVFQFALEHVGPGIALSRSARSVQMHQRVQSGDTELSSSVQAMSLSHTTESYVESGRGWEFKQPQYQVIPWDNHGKGVLTVRLGLFYLCLMAGYGWNHIQNEYPKLNTWCQLDDGTFRHNTSGLVKTALGPKDKLESSASEDVEVDQYAGEEVEQEEGERYDEAGYDDEAGAYEASAYEAGAYEEGGHGEEYEEDKREGEYEYGQVEYGEGEHEHGQGDDALEEQVVEAERSQASPSNHPPTSKVFHEVTVKKNKKGKYVFKGRTGDTVEVGKKDWHKKKRDGRSVFVYEGRKTNYFTEKLP